MWSAFYNEEASKMSQAGATAAALVRMARAGPKHAMLLNGHKVIKWNSVSIKKKSDLLV